MTYPPSSKMTLAAFEQFARTQLRVEYRLVCDVCKFEHSGTVAAKSRPDWILVTWTCHSCKSSDPVDYIQPMSARGIVERKAVHDPACDGSDCDFSALDEAIDYLYARQS